MIHEALSLIRVFHKMKQKELAEKLEISRSYMSGIESGKKKPTYDLLQRYSNIFDVPISSLFLLSEFMEKEQVIDFQVMPKKAVLMLELIQENKKNHI